MKCRLFSILIAFGLLAKVASAQTPILEYTFNETGTTAASTGSNPTALALIDSGSNAADLHSAGGLGVSGSATDSAFDNTQSTGMGNDGVGGVALVPPNTLGTLDSFTFQCWFKVATPIDNLARLIHCGTISAQANAGSIVLHVNSNFTTSSAGYSQTNEWVFMAFTYDGTKTVNNVNFYVGTATQPVQQVGSVATINSGSVAQGGNSLGFGNDANFTNARPLDGYMDDIRIYGSGTDGSGALTPAQLEIVRRRDVLNELDVLTKDKVAITGNVIVETNPNGKTSIVPITINKVLNLLGVTGQPPADQLRYYYDSTTESFVIAPKSYAAAGIGKPLATVFTDGDTGLGWDPTKHSSIGAESASGLDGELAGDALINSLVAGKLETSDFRFSLFGTVSNLPAIMKGTVIDVHQN